MPQCDGAVRRRAAQIDLWVVERGVAGSGRERGIRARLNRTFTFAHPGQPSTMGPDPSEQPVRHSNLAWHGPTGGEPFTHPAVFYRTLPEYLLYTVPFLLAGQAAQEPTEVAVPGPNLRAMQAELTARGGDVDLVRWLDMTEVGRNPGRIIATVLRAFADQYPAQRVRIIGESIWAERSHTEYPACVQHEAWINAAFTGRQATILCPYDTERLSPIALTDAAITHPILVDNDHWLTSSDYAPHQIVSTYNQPLHAPDSAEEIPVGPTTLGHIRRWTHTLATQAGLLTERITDAVYVVSELATNSIEHGTGAAQLLGWSTPTDLVFHAVNAGRMTNSLVGRLPVPHDQQRGRGLLLVNTLADLVRIHTSQHHTTIRAYFHRPAGTG